MENSLRILLIEDNEADARLIREMFEEGNAQSFYLAWEKSISQGLKLLSEESFDALLLDLYLPDSGGIETVDKILLKDPLMPLIVLTGLVDDTLGIEAVHRGAQDYISKGSVNSDLLIRSIRYSIERKHLMTELQKQSIHDDLTGLYNRRGFLTLSEKQVQLCNREKRRLWFIVADLDGLKEVNDNFGHDAGDQAIRDAAEILGDTFRAADIIGRIGGDEFAIVAPEKTTAPVVEIISTRIEDKTEAFRRTSKRPYSISISFGITCKEPGSPRSVEEMLAEADKLMYEQKRKKKGFHLGLPG